MHSLGVDPELGLAPEHRRAAQGARLVIGLRHDVPEAVLGSDSIEKMLASVLA